MASFEISFTLRTISAFASRIRPKGEEFDVLSARLLGRSEELHGSFDTAAQQFSSSIAWDISSLAAEDRQLWLDSTAALSFGSMVTEMWADYVQAFWDERAEIQSEWRSAVQDCEGRVPSKFQNTTITLTFPERNFGWTDENKCRDLYEELQTKRGELYERFYTLWNRYQGEVDEISMMLEEGATKVNVQKLIDGGYANWSFYNIDPSKYTMMVDTNELTEENAQEMAEELSAYWSGEKPLDDRYHELMIFMSMIGTNAAQAQQNGTAFREEEIDFLRAFYGALEDNDPHGKGVIGIPSQMSGSHLSEEEQEYALGVLGDGLLALSDHRIGGGYYDLPESVRIAAEGHHLIPGGSIVNSDLGTRALAQLLGNANKEMEAGYGLSNTLTLSMGLYAVEGTGTDGLLISDEEMLQLLDVSTRNKDANHDILTGDYVHPNFSATYEVDGETTYPGLELSGFDSPQEMLDKVIEGLFTRDWPDDGETVSQLTDWIAEDELNGTPEEKERAGSAGAGFIETVTRQDLFAALTGVEDPEGGPDIPMGEVNPHVSQSMARVFHAYVDDFGVGVQNSEHNGFHTDASTDQFAFAEDGNVLLMDEMSRVRFMELIMGDEHSAAGMYATIEEHKMENLNEALESGEFSEESTKAGGRLSYLFESAFDNYAMSQFDRGIDAYEKEVKIKKEGWDIFIGTASGPIPYAGGFVGDAGKAIVGPLVENSVDRYSTLQESIEGREELPTYDRDSYHFDIQLQIINQMVENGDIDINDLPKTVLTEGGNSVARSGLEANIASNTPGHLLETIDENILTEDHSGFAREYSSFFDEGYNSFGESNLRVDDKEEYNTHINPGRRS